MGVSLVLLCLLIGSVHADPKPETPGNSGDHNPHGAPPGQGGETPGNSGESNPHGSPPGQREAGPGASSGKPAAPGAPGVAPSPGSAIPSASKKHQPSEGRKELQPHGAPVAPYNASADYLGPHHDAASLLWKQSQELKRLKGWEPIWLMMAERFEQVRVHVNYACRGQSTSFESTTIWWQDGLRRACRDQLHNNGWYEWRSTPEGGWQRWERQPWTSVRFPARSPLQPATAMDVLQAWGGQPLETRDEGGRVVIRLKKNFGFGVQESGGEHPVHGQGYLDLESDRTTGEVARIRELNADGSIIWEEDRKIAMAGNLATLTWRRRTHFGKFPYQEEEACTWMFGSEALSDAVFTDPTPVHAKSMRPSRK